MNLYAARCRQAQTPTVGLQHMDEVEADASPGEWTVQKHQYVTRGGYIRLRPRVLRLLSLIPNALHPPTTHHAECGGDEEQRGPRLREVQAHGHVLRGTWGIASGDARNETPARHLDALYLPPIPCLSPPLPTHLQAAHVWKSLSPERKEAQVLSAKRHFETAGPVAVPTTHRAVVDEEVDMSQRRKEKKEKKEKKHKKDKYRMLSQ